MSRGNTQRLFGRAAKGFSLLEILIMSAVVILLMTVVLKLLATVYKGTKGSAEEVSVQQTTALVLDRLTRDLKSSSSNQMLLTPNLVAIRPLESLTAEGRQVWSEELKIYRYDAAENSILVSQYRLKTDDTNKSGLNITADTLLLEDLPEKVLAKGVSSFALQEGSTLQLNLTVESMSRTRSLSVERAIHLPLRMR